MFSFHCLICQNIHHNAVLKEDISFTQKRLKQYSGKYILLKCKCCSHGSIVPRIEKADFYEELYRIDDSKSNKNEHLCKNHIFDSIIKEIQLLNNETYFSIMDIGCSNGFFLDQMKCYNYETIGVEINDSKRIFTKSKGHNVFKNIEQYSKKVDIISLIDTLEHVQDPVKMISNAKSALNKNGLLIIKVPILAGQIFKERIKSLLDFTTKGISSHLHHINLFSFNSLEKLLIDNHFKVLKIKTMPSEIVDKRSLRQLGVRAYSIFPKINKEMSLHGLVIAKKCNE